MNEKGGACVVWLRAMLFYCLKVAASIMRDEGGRHGLLSFLSIAESAPRKLHPIKKGERCG